MAELWKYCGPIVCFSGLVIFGVCTATNKYNDLKRIGEIMFFAGLIAVCFRG